MQTLYFLVSKPTPYLRDFFLDLRDLPDFDEERLVKLRTKLRTSKKS